MKKNKIREINKFYPCAARKEEIMSYVKPNVLAQSIKMPKYVVGVTLYHFLTDRDCVW